MTRVRISHSLLMFLRCFSWGSVRAIAKDLTCNTFSYGRDHLSNDLMAPHASKQGLLFLYPPWLLFQRSQCWSLRPFVSLCLWTFLPVGLKFSLCLKLDIATHNARFPPLPLPGVRVPRCRHCRNCPPRFSVQPRKGILDSLGYSLLVFQFFSTTCKTCSESPYSSSFLMVTLIQASLTTVGTCSSFHTRLWLSPNHSPDSSRSNLLKI